MILRICMWVVKLHRVPSMFTNITTLRPLTSTPLPTAPGPSCGGYYCFNGAMCVNGSYCECLGSYTGTYCQYRDCELLSWTTFSTTSAPSPPPLPPILRWPTLPEWHLHSRYLWLLLLWLWLHRTQLWDRWGNAPVFVHCSLLHEVALKYCLEGVGCKMWLTHPVASKHASWALSGVMSCDVMWCHVVLFASSCRSWVLWLQQQLHLLQQRNMLQWVVCLSIPVHRIRLHWLQWQWVLGDRGGGGGGGGMPMHVNYVIMPNTCCHVADW